MITKADVDSAKFDVVFITTLLLVSHFINSQTLSVVFLNKEWTQKSISFLIAFVLYDIIMNRFTVSIIGGTKVHNKQVLASMNDIIKFSSIFIIKE